MRVFLTGATGLVGSHVAERLRARGHTVRALLRTTSDARALDTLGIERAAGDITDPAEQLAERMIGCDAVIHSAALLYRRASWALYQRVNVDGAAHVLRAAARAGVRRVLHVSSVAVYGGAAERERITEELWRDEPVAAWDYYARSKRAAEEIAWRLYDDGAIRLTTLRPAAIYGERDRLLTLILARLARLPALPLPAGGDTTVPVVYAGNVASGVVAALEHEAAIGRAYNLSDDGPLTARTLVTTFARALFGRAPRILAVPGAVLLPLATLADAITRVVPGLPRARIRRAVRLLLRDNPYDAQRARSELGWTAILPHEQALVRTAEWYRRAHLISRES